jgi:hypothetical protein
MAKKKRKRKIVDPYEQARKEVEATLNDRPKKNRPAK